MRDSVHFLLDHRPVTLEFGPGSEWRPTTTLLQYLRTFPEHRGVKEGCAEGDCGACTVVLAEPRAAGGLSYRAVDSCLVFLPFLDRKQLITIEGLKAPDGSLHPVQTALIRHYGSQCGFCTPGIVMSLFALHKRYESPGRPAGDAVTRSAAIDALAGNLCRCTGYRPIVDAALEVCAQPVADHFSGNEKEVCGKLSAITREDLLIQSDGQRYFRPVSLSSALSYRNDHPDALIINGATDVALRVTKQHEILPSILDLSGIDELKSWTRTARGLESGAGTTIQDLLEASAEQFPALAQMLQVFGSRQIRNVATLGGNIGTASPIGDTLPVLMALRAEIHLRSIRATRSVPIDEFFTGYRSTACKPDELITGAKIPDVPAATLVRSYKVSRRHDLDISSVSAGFRIALNSRGAVDDILLAYGGMAATPSRAKKTESSLRGKPWTRDAVESAMGMIESDFTPLTDVRGSAEYRLIVARNLLLKFWDETAHLPATAAEAKAGVA
ncbi:MAG: FAD-binding molybdopterin dehydrogenase [Bacteroidetes bacterium]|nr:FAD-binding molybdopterin dehydrogenase [Bacteroidota bacterium]